MKLKLSATAVALCFVTTGAVAQQDYPNRDIELVVPYSAGGSVDGMARAFSTAFSEALGGVSVVVQNRDGAGGVIGVSAVVNASPDGYTVLFSPSSPLTQAPFLTGNVPYQMSDLHPVCQLFENPFVVAVRDESPLKSIQQLLDEAKAAPGAVSYGHAGIGSVPQLATASLAKATGVEFNDIAFRGDAMAIPQVLGGHVDFGALGASAVAGKNMRVLAALGANRVSAFPDAPSATELGVKHPIIARNGLYVSSKAPAAAREKLEAACKTAIESPAFRKAAEAQSQQISYMDSAAFTKQLSVDYDANRELIQSLDLAAKK